MGEAGGHSIVIPVAETAKALRAQRVEALDQEMANASALGLHKVAPHVTETGHTWTVRPLLMSGHTWKKLTPEQREIVVAAAKEASRVARQAEWKQNDEATVQMKAEGVRFYPFPAEAQGHAGADRGHPSQRGGEARRRGHPHGDQDRRREIEAG